MVRRSLTISLLAMLMATALAVPRTGASNPVNFVKSDGGGSPASQTIPAPEAAERILGDSAEDLLVGHADVLRLYWAFFSRDPDSAGARYWLNLFDAGSSIDGIASSFAASDEFANTYGSTTDREFVRIVYGNVLGRTPDTAGFEYWVGLLSSPAVSRIDVVRWVSASSEFINAHPYRRPTIAAAMTASGDVAVAVEVVEALVGQRPSAALVPDRSADLVAAIDRLQKEFGPFSSVTPGPCQAGGGGSICEVNLSEVGLSRPVSVSVLDGLVVGINIEADADAWADAAVRTAVTGRTVFGSHRFDAAARKTLGTQVRRIRPAIGTIGQAAAVAGECTNSTIAAQTPDTPDVARRACAYRVTGPLLAISVEAVTHNGVFAGINVEVPRQYSETGFSPYATINAGGGTVTLHHPANRVERIGYHESGHDGARMQDPVETSTVVTTMDSRGRGNGSRTAADIAIHPGDEIRSPVTGTVLRAGSYVLYCKHTDHYLVIEPDSRPGYEVKVLHFEGLSVAKGDRVEAGRTVVGTNVRKLPFESQIDKTTADPSNGHIHIEVVDPTIPDRPSGGGC